jgi:hypothetical protein
MQNRSSQVHIPSHKFHDSNRPFMEKVTTCLLYWQKVVAWNEILHLIAPDSIWKAVFRAADEDTVGFWCTVVSLTLWPSLNLIFDIRDMVWLWQLNASWLCPLWSWPGLTSSALEMSPWACLLQAHGKNTPSFVHPLPPHSQLHPLLFLWSALYQRGWLVQTVFPEYVAGQIPVYLCSGRDWQEIRV